MKNTFLLLLLLLVGEASMWGQNYQAFDPTAEVYYTTVKPDPLVEIYPLHALVARGLNPNQSDVYYAYKVLQMNPDSSAGCYNLEGTSWMGDSVWVKSDSQTFFYNYLGLPIMIRPLARLNQSWLMYEEPGAFYVMAKLESISIGGVGFQSFTDSIKTIQLQVFAPDSSVLDNHPLHHFEMRLSEYYGFIKMPAFGYFGKEGESYYLTEFLHQKRRGLFDWGIGDEHQTIKGDITTFYHVIGREGGPNADTVFYEIEKTIQTPNGISIDTVNVYYDHLDERIDQRAPNEVKIVGQADPIGPIDYYTYSLGEYSALQMDYVYPFSLNNGCYQDQVVGTGITYTYVGDVYLGWPGVGILENTHGENGYFLPEVLIYYKRGNEIFGKATSITPEISSPADFKLSPNPANQSVIISWVASPFEENRVRLIDIQGRVFTPPILDERLGVRRSLTLDSRQLPNGIYFLQIFGPHALYSHKIMIQH